VTGRALLVGRLREGSAKRDGALSLGDCVGTVAEPRALALILSKRLSVGPAGGAVVTLGSGCLGWTGCLSEPPPGCLNVETTGFLLTGTGGDLLVVVFGVGGSLWFSRSTGFVSTGPMLMFPANEGTVFLPSVSPTIFGTLLSETVFEAMIASAVRFLFSPRGPGQPSQPS